MIILNIDFMSIDRKENIFKMLFSIKQWTLSMLKKDSMAKRKYFRLHRNIVWSEFVFRFFLYLFLGAVLVLLGFVGYQYVLSPRVKRAAGKSSSQSYLAGQQAKGSYDPDWIPKHHLQSKFNDNRNRKRWLVFSSIVGRSPKKSPNPRKSRKPDSDVDGASGTGAASSENDE